MGLMVLTSDTGFALSAAAGGVVDSMYDTGSPSNSGAVKLDLGELGATDAVLLGRGWNLPVHMCEYDLMLACEAAAGACQCTCQPALLPLEPVHAYNSGLLLGLKQCCE